MSAKDVKEKKKHPSYLVITPIDELLDEGLQFDGESEKDRMVNMTDFVRIRDMMQRFSGNLTGDQNETLLRSLKSCIKNAEEVS